MSRKRLAARFVLAMSVVVASAVPVTAMTLEEVLAKNHEARGGLDRLRAVESARFAGKMVMPGGLEAPFVWEWKRPNKMRIEFTLQGMTGVMASDGSSGWRIMPFMGKTEPERMTDEEFKEIEPQADFTGMLVDPEQKGYEIEYVGETDVEGTPAHKLKVTRKATGDVSYIYLDAEYFVEIRRETRRKVRDQVVEGETTIGDYKEVDGLMIPHSIASKVKGAPDGRTIVIEKAELGVEIPDERFRMPEASPGAAAE